MTVRLGREPNAAAARVKLQHLHNVGFPSLRGLGSAQVSGPGCAKSGNRRSILATHSRMGSADASLRTGDRGDSVVAPWVPICAGRQRVAPLSFWLLFRCTLNNQGAEQTPRRFYQSRPGEPLPAGTCCRADDPAKAARECDPVSTDPPTRERYCRTEGRDEYPRVVVKFEVQRVRRFRAPGDGKHNG